MQDKGSKLFSSAAAKVWYKRGCGLSRAVSLSDVVKGFRKNRWRTQEKRKMKREIGKNRCRLTGRGKVHVNLQHVV